MRFRRRESSRQHQNPETALRVERLEDRTLLTGSLDPLFNGTGTQTVNFGDDDRANGVAIQADGKVVMAGSWDGGSANFAVARLNSLGSLDLTFDGDGRFDFTFGGVDFAKAVALQADGKIVVAGYTDVGGTNDFAVIRVNTNGAIDTTFNGTGSRVIDFGFDDRANAVVIQPDGKIILAGSIDGGSADFALARLNSDGTLDQAFDTDGIYSFTFGGVDVCNAVALQRDGRIVMAGSSNAFSASNDFAVARVNSNGTLDTTFDSDGLAVVDFGYDDQATGVALMRDGKIVLGGFDDGGLADFAVARLNSGGTLDPTFNSMTTPTQTNGNGKLSFTFGASGFGGVEQARALALQQNGKILLAGYTDAGGGSGPHDFAIARVNPNGTLDLSFGGTGKRTIDFGDDDRANAVAVQPNGKIVVAGETSPGGGAIYDFAAARLIGANTSFVAVGGQAGRVQVMDMAGATLGSFFPFAASGFTDAIAIAVGDVNSDGIDDLITAATIGNPNVKVYSGATVSSGSFFSDPEAHLLANGFPFGINFNVGASVAAGDVNGDGYADIIAGAFPGNPHVKVFDSKEVLVSGFIPTVITPVVLAEGFVYGLSFNVGANVGAGDVDGDGLEDVITGATAGNPHTKIFDAKDFLASGILNAAALMGEYFPYALSFNVGAFVTAGDYNGDGYPDIITGSSIGNPQVVIMDGQDIAEGTFDPVASVLDSIFAFELNQNIGVAVGAADFTGDGRADVLVGTRNGSPRVRVYEENLPGISALVSGWDVTAPAFTGALYVGV